MSRSAFDTAAPRYDTVFSDTVIGGLQRSAVHHYLDRHGALTPPLSILELGCGTGEDAVRFAENGHNVTATDVSAPMLAVARRKAESRGLADRIQTAPLDLRAPERSRVEGPFDLIFSNFGALNCIDQHSIAGLSTYLAEVSRPGCRAIFIVMPRACLWESMYFLLRGRPNIAFRRLKNGPISAAVGEQSVSTWYHSPSTIARAFGLHFRRRATMPVGFAVPPSFLEPWATRYARTVKALAAIDQGVQPFGFLASISDHALIDMERI